MKFTTMINEQIWTIEEKNRDEIKGRLDASGMCLGMCEYEPRIITLANNLSREQKMNTLRHELVHAFLFAYGFMYFQTFTDEQMADFFGYYGDKMNDIVRSYFDD